MTTPPPRPYASIWHRLAANVRQEPAPAWVSVDGPCLVWQGKKNRRRYGWISMRVVRYTDAGPVRVQRNVLVHRLVLSLLGVPWEAIPVGAHLCSNKACCNAKHLDAQTHSQNRRHYLDVERQYRE